LAVYPYERTGKMSGLIKVLVNGKQVVESVNSLTNMYRNTVAKLLAGEASNFLPYCAIGIGSGTPGPDSVGLADEIYRLPVTYRFSMLSYYTRFSTMFNVITPPLGDTGSPIAVTEAGLFTAGQLSMENASFEDWGGTPPASWFTSGDGVSLAKSIDAYDGTAAAYLGGTGSEVHMGQYIGGSPGTPTGTPTYVDIIGQTIDFVAPVKCGSANIARVYITDGAGTAVSSYHSGGSAYERLRASRLVSDDADRFEVGMMLTGAGSAIIDWALATQRGDVLAIGSASFSKGSHDAALIQWDIFQEEIT